MDILRMISVTPRIRLAARRLMRRPWESLFAALALGLGLGAVVATWAVVDAVLLRPLPGNDDGRLVALIQTRLDDGSQYSVNSVNAERWRRAELLDGLAASRPAAWTLRADDGTPRRIEGHEVEPGYFDLLGLDARLGRTFAARSGGAEESTLDDAVVVSEPFWRTELGADPNVVGRTLDFAEGPRVILGVMSPVPRIERLSLGDVWTPLLLRAAATEDVPLRGLRVLARMDPGVALAAAQAELDAVAAGLAEERPETNEGWGVTVEPIETMITGRVRGPLLSLLAVAAVLLLVSVTTVGSLGVARGLDRRGEIAVRRALGARGGDLASSWLVEWMLVGLLGGLLGLLPAALGLELFVRRNAEQVPRIEAAALHPSVLLMSLAAALIVGSLVGVLGLPSLLASSKDGEAARLKERASNAGAGHRVGYGAGTTLSALVSAQTSLAVLALVAALLLGRSLVALGDEELGFEPDGLVAFRLDLPADYHEASKEERLEIWRGVLDRLEALPGVEHAAVASSMPLSGRYGVFEVWVEGDESSARSATPDIRTLAQIASPGLLDASGIELVAGRSFSERETWDERHAVLVNRAFVREHLSGSRVGRSPSDALGRKLRWQSGDVGEIVGVVDDVRQVALFREAEPEIFIAWGNVSGSRTVLLRGSSLDLETIRRAVSEVLPSAPVYGVRTGEQLVAGELAQRKLLVSLSAAFAGLAQVLALVGLFGVVAGRVVRARRDLAVRMALGARGADVRRWTLGVALVPVAVGAAAGLVLAWAAGGVIESQLYGVGVLDPVSYLLAVVLAVAGSAAVAQVPASRAARMDPARTLRETG